MQVDCCHLRDHLYMPIRCMTRTPMSYVMIKSSSAYNLQSQAHSLTHQYSTRTGLIQACAYTLTVQTMIGFSNSQPSVGLATCAAIGAPIQSMMAYHGAWAKNDSMHACMHHPYMDAFKQDCMCNAQVQCPINMCNQCEYLALMLGWVC